MKFFNALFIVIVGASFILISWLYFGNKAASGQKSAEGNTLIVGTDPEFPPFGYLEKGTLAGFDIDLMKAIAQQLKKIIDWRQMSFDALLTGIQLGEIQVVAAGMTPTAERAERVLFTRPYLEDALVIVIPASLAESIKTLDDLKNKKVVVVQGYTADFYLSKHPEIEVLRLATPLEAFMALQAGHAMAFVSAARILPPFLEKVNTDTFTLIKLPDVEESAALAISKKHPELLAPIQMALDELETNGTLDALKKKWNVLDS